MNQAAQRAWLKLDVKIASYQMRSETFLIERIEKHNMCAGLSTPSVL